MFRNFAYLSRSDRKVIVFLLVLIVAGGLVLYGSLGDSTSNQLTPADSVSSGLRSWHVADSASRQYVYAVESSEPERFVFDPNTADSTQLLRLGLQPWQVRNIYKYRARGGVYREPSDFSRLYGLTVKQYRELLPYIRISSDYRPASTLYPQRRDTFVRDTLDYPVKLKPMERLQLNDADTAQLRRVPGIGRYYAREIDHYRRQLGGFCRVEQLREIEGFPDTAMTYFLVDASAVKRININRLTLSQLKRHPYINFYQARAICDYRRLKGRIGSLSDLKLLEDFSESDLIRLAPYVEF